MYRTVGVVCGGICGGMGRGGGGEKGEQEVYIRWGRGGWGSRQGCVPLVSDPASHTPSTPPVHPQES